MDDAEENSKYAEDTFEDEEEKEPGSHSIGSWSEIDFADVSLGKCIGGGGVGMVYEGTFEGKRVALKTLFDPRVDQNLRKEFGDELLVMSRLSHPNVVHFVGACTVPPKLFFVMELCDASLFELLHVQRRRLGTREALDVAVGVAKAMAYLHSRSPPIIHRDLKSHNVLIAGEDIRGCKRSNDDAGGRSSNGRRGSCDDVDNCKTEESDGGDGGRLGAGYVRLCDFGLARGAEPGAGTPQYMAPEALRGRPSGPEADVYAFGVLLWEMFAQEVPYDGLEPPEIRDLVVAGKRPRRDRFHIPAAREIAEDCWAEEPRARPRFCDLVPRLMTAAAAVAEDEGPAAVSVDTVAREMGGDCLDALLLG
ncbi:unnamed protein product [Phaeothamnion confervicola]